jgi:hypothetical protein
MSSGSALKTIHNSLQRAVNNISPPNWLAYFKDLFPKPELNTENVVVETPLTHAHDVDYSVLDRPIDDDEILKSIHSLR